MTTTENLTIRPFEISIPDDALADLKRRLATTRFPHVPQDDGWEAGTPVAYLRDMVERWQ